MGCLARAKFETQDTDKQLRYLFNISKQTCPPGSPSILQFLHTTEYGWQTPSTLNSPAQRLGCPHLEGSSLNNADVFGSLPLLYLCPLGLCTRGPGPAQSGLVHSRLSQMSDTAFALPHIYHKLSPPPYLGAATPFLPVSFLSFFFTQSLAPWPSSFYISFLL